MTYEIRKVGKQYRDAFHLAVLNDLADLTPLGPFPVVGDLLDALTLALSAHVAPHYAKSKPFLVQLLEFLPLSDFLPVHTIAVVTSYAEERNLTPVEALRELMEIEELAPETLKEKFKELLE